MPESLVFTSSALAGCGVGRLGHSGGRNDETSQEPPSFLSQEILNLKQNVFLFLFELEIAVLILTDDTTEEPRILNWLKTELADRLTWEMLCLVTDIVNISSCQRRK